VREGEGPLERLCKEIKLGTAVVGIYPTRPGSSVWSAWSSPSRTTSVRKPSLITFRVNGDGRLGPRAPGGGRALMMAS